MYLNVEGIKIQAKRDLSFFLKFFQSVAAMSHTNIQKIFSGPVHQSGAVCDYAKLGT